MTYSTMAFVRLSLLIAMGMALITVPAYTMAGENMATKTMTLIAPQKTIGKPVMEALNLRMSKRDMSDKALSPQDLSNLLWAAWGANRDDGKRTIPTARNKQELELFVALKTGVWQYDGIKHTLTLVKNTDFTSKFGAPATFIYTAPEDTAAVSGMHIGSMYQNVALYCASANLSNVVKTSVLRIVDGEFTLPDDYKIFVVQLVGMPD